MIGALGKVLPWMRPPATVPSMDGALRPNRALDEAALLAECPAPDNLVWQDDHLLFTSGKRVLLLDSLHHEGAEPEEILQFDSAITALAAAEDGSLAVGLGASGIAIVGGAHDGRTIAGLGNRKLIAPTALCFADPDTLFVAVGSDIHGAEDWRRDLLEHRAAGAVWRVPLERGDPVCLAAHLAFPNGLLLRDGGRIAVSEAWRHRLLDFPTQERGAPRVLLDDLPGYPGRLSPAPDGGAWLSVFAPRSQLVEFVLREDRYRHWMMQTIEPAHWIAPSLRAGLSYKEPMQGGAVKTLGIFKPWAPSRSYGLAVKLDGDFIPTTSLHSRADGKRHGVTSCLETRGELIVACKGDNALVSVDLAQEREV
ncbi:SMP-30/gluconolactonase/LRE family protein [Dongia sp. agr-C8]